MKKLLKLLEFCKNESIPVHIVTDSMNITAANALIKEVCNVYVTVEMEKHGTRSIQLDKISSVGILFH